MNDLYNKIKKCSSCELCSSEKNSIRILPSGFIGSNFMMIGISPSYNASPKKQEYFFGDSDNQIFNKNKKILKTLFSNIGIDFDTMWKTNVQKCIGKNNDFNDNYKYFNTCYNTILKDEIKKVKPKIIFALGDEVGKLFFANEFLKIYFNEEFNCKVVKIYHPSYHTRGGITEEKYINQFEKISEELEKIIIENFVNFHHHNQFSLRDGMSDEKEISKKLYELKSPGFCLTNHGNINCHLRQQKAAKEFGIKTIFGTEIYYNENVKKLIPLLESTNKDDIQERKKIGKETFHLTVLAKNLKGYYNLISLNNFALMNSFYKFPLIDDEMLMNHKDGLIILSGCPGAYIPVNLLIDEKIAYKKAEYFKSELKENFFIELMSTGYDSQIELNNKLLSLSKNINTDFVITNDSHYVNINDSKYHDIMLLSGTKNTIDDISDPTKKTWTFSVKDLYLKSSEQILRDVNFLKSENYNEEIAKKAILNVNRLFSKIDSFDIDMSPRYPKLSNEDSTDLFLKLIKEGINKRKNQIDLNSERFKKQLSEEIQTISNLGYLDYFIVLQDIINWCKNKFGRYSVGPGRGSAAASLVSYLLNITDINPLKYDFMLFERFMSPGRKDPPDIDSDFAPSIRPYVIEYAIEKFGRNHVFPVGTHGTIKLKMAILDVLKVLGVNFSDIVKFTKKMDVNYEIEDLNTEDALKKFPDLEKFIKENHPDAIIAIDKIRNKIKSFGQHAGGLVISSVDITKTLPLAKTSTGTFVTSNTEGGDNHEITEMGFIKYDILSLTTLDNILMCDNLIKENHKIEVDWDYIIDNENEYSEMYKILIDGDTFGIFQFSSDLAISYLKNLNPTCLNDLCAASGLIRPGPLDQGSHLDYAKRKNNLEEYSVPEQLEPYLRETYGILVYQEQFLKIIQEVSELSKEDSSVLRKALVKYEKSIETEKIRKEKVLSFKKRVIDGFIKKGMSNDDSEKWWNYIESFSRYGFNFAHSMSYAYSSFRQLWQKYYYTIEFYCTVLNNSTHDELSTVVSNINRFDSRKIVDNKIIKYKIKILPPCLKSMNINFAIEGDNIRYGMSSIKYISIESFNLIKEYIKDEHLDSFDKIISVKYIKNGKNKFVIDKKIVSALIFSGALDYLNMTRNDLIEKYNKIRKSNIEIPKNEKDLLQLEKNYIGFQTKGLDELREISNNFFNKNKELKTLRQTYFDNINGSGYGFGFVVKKTKKKTKTNKEYELIEFIDIDGNKFNPIFLWNGNMTINTPYFIELIKEGNFTKINNFLKVDEL